MRVPIAALADSANATPDGKLNIFGIFGEIRSAAFPAVHPSACLVVAFHFELPDAGREFHVRVALTDSDTTLVQIEGAFVVPRTPELEAGRWLLLNQVFQLNGLPVPHAGEYAFHIFVNDREEALVRYQAVPLGSAPTG